MSPARYHIAGVAGSGMSALAQLLIAGGNTVSGSDRLRDKGENTGVFRKLLAAGVLFFPQDGSGVAGSECTVVTSSAVEKDNPDLAAAEKLGAEIVHRAEMLARLAAGKELIAVTGTSGKSTVTGMIGWILEKMGCDPTVVNGGVLVNWAGDSAIGNVRIGRAGPWVIEADESDRSLMRFFPDWAVITNAGRDHFDADATERLFTLFGRQVRRGVVGWPAPPSVPDSIVEESFAGTTFTYGGVPFRVCLPGRHNVRNAIHAIALCEKLGYSLRSIGEVLVAFRGIERRMQTVGTMSNGAVVIDDFAHNPAKIGAAWETAAACFRRVLAVWRPHGFRPLQFMQDELADVISSVCRPCDHICLLPVYYPGGTVADRSVTSWSFMVRLRERGIAAYHARDYPACVEHIVSLAERGDAVLVMGARDPHLPQLAREMVSRSNF